MDSIEIRAAMPHDAEPIASYHRRCFQKTYAVQLDAGVLQAPDLEGMEQQFREWFGPGSGFETHVAVIDRAPIAHFTLCGNQLVHLFVAPEHHGTGLGRRLLAQGESLLAENGHTTFELHARIDNLPALGFYRAAGWLVTDEVIHTVEHGIGYDEHVLIKRQTTD